VRPVDLLPLEGFQKISLAAQPPWVISPDLSVLQLLSQFRTNGPSLAVIVGTSGEAIGWLSWNDLLQLLLPEAPTESPLPFVERTLRADLPIATFNRLYGANLDGSLETVGHLVAEQLGHMPTEGDVVRVGGFEWTVSKASLKGPEKIHVRTLD
jgi:magnesium and cobalt transporter